MTTHDKFEPKLRVKASGFGGSGYNIATRTAEDGGRLVYPGVTTVTGALDKGGIPQWAVNQTAAYAVHNVDALLSRTQDQGYNMLRWYWSKRPDFDDPEVDITSYHHGVLNDAAELGTLTHDWVAEHVLGNFEPDLIRPEQVRMIETFLEWEAQHHIEVRLVESTVVGSGYAGTLDHIWDIMCLHEGEPCIPKADVEVVTALIDVKTSRSTQDVHYAQLGALGAADTLMVQVDEDFPDAVLYDTKKWGKTYWVEDVLPDFSEYAILQIRPDDRDHNGIEVPAFTRMKYIPHDVVDTAYEVFLGALQARHGQLELKRAKKAHGIA